MSLTDTIRINTETVIGETELEDRLHGNKPLRVKLGVDPTRPDLTFGHLVVFNKLRQFQDPRARSSPHHWGLYHADR